MYVPRNRRRWVTDLNLSHNNIFIVTNLFLCLQIDMSACFIFSILSSPTDLKIDSIRPYKSDICFHYRQKKMSSAHKISHLTMGSGFASPFLCVQSCGILYFSLPELLFSVVWNMICMELILFFHVCLVHCMRQFLRLLVMELQQLWNWIQRMRLRDAACSLQYFAPMSIFFIIR